MSISKFCMCLAFLFFPCLNFAALPPIFEDIAEIKAILDDQKFINLLDSADSIKEISKKENGYLVKTNKLEIFARIIYKPIPRPGPLSFDIVIEAPKEVKSRN
ncbi:MAG: hypothetical protein J0H93_11340 [Chlamydiales bacterium]|nr:hypothetical protein [Chlamydiales bacterium]